MKHSSLFVLMVFSFLTAIAGCVACGAQSQTAMKPTSTEQPAFDVIGIEARTNNSAESTGGGAIPKLWQRLFMENLLNQIPDRLDQSIVAVYSNYASDWNGDYTFTLGAKVKPGTKTPDGMVSKHLAATRYLEFHSEQGVPAQVVPAMWKGVWDYFQVPENPQRAYGSDYELYEAITDPNNVEVKLFIGVKP
jgi:predicted transcriptional regulator YdeE